MLLLGAARFVKAIRFAGLVGGKPRANVTAGLFGHGKVASVSMLSSTSLRRADEAYKPLTFA